MAYKGLFIGADTYQSISAPDLPNARRDALALWALFSDTVTELESSILTGDDATHTAVREKITQTLQHATDSDVIIISFAGHGTKDHRIFLHDSEDNKLDETCVAMSDIASLFKASQAKAILFILDCCFSGGAPARVVETTPQTRSLNPYEGFGGTGRMLIAAADIDQLAYELPREDHGILTYAVIKALQEGEGTVDVMSAMSKAMDMVNSEAARLGVSQRSTICGHIQGGLKFPVLKPGHNFYAAFPDLTGIKITGKISELTSFGIPESIVNAWKERFQADLNDLQVEAINKYRVLNDQSLLVVAPTSSGKTFVGEMAAVKSVVEGKKAVFLLPYKALVNEKFDEFSLLYGGKLGMRIIRCTGDFGDQVSAFTQGKYDIAFLTYETFLNIILNRSDILYKIGLTVVDEGHFISDDSRGITVELLLTYLITAREKDIAPQLIVLSAVIGNSSNLEKWLGCNLLLTDRRPVPLVEGVINRDGTFVYKDEVDGQKKTDLLLNPSAIVQRKARPEKQDVIVPLVKSLVRNNERIIILRSKRASASGCAGYLSKELGLPSADSTIAALPVNAQTQLSPKLRECLQGGVAFHTADLTPEERLVIEQEYRKKDGEIRVLCATTTVAAGLNTPASTVIIADYEFFNRAFFVSEYKNISGRAGRLGFNEMGRSIMIAESSYEAEQLFSKYVMSQPEDAKSSFDPEKPETWLIRLLAQHKLVKKSEAPHLLSSTFGGYLRNQLDPEWKNKNEQSTSLLIEQMIELGLIEQDEDQISLTLLGQACGKSTLSFKSAMLLVGMLKSFTPGTTNPMKLLALVQCLPEMDNVYTPLQKQGQSETIWSTEVAGRYGSEIVRIFQNRIRGDQLISWARCKRADIIYDWIEGVRVQEIEKKYTKNTFFAAVAYGDINTIATNTRFHLKPAYDIAKIVDPTLDGSEEMDVLISRLEFGVPAQAVPLLDGIPFRLTRDEYLNLCDAGIENFDQLKKIDKDQLQKMIDPVRANRLYEDLS